MVEFTIFILILPKLHKREKLINHIGKILVVSKEVNKNYNLPKIYYSLWMMTIRAVGSKFYFLQIDIA
jgi:hypothetical protein